MRRSRVRIPKLVTREYHLVYEIVVLSVYAWDNSIHEIITIVLEVDVHSFITTKTAIESRSKLFNVDQREFGMVWKTTLPFPVQAMAM